MIGQSSLFTESLEMPLRRRVTLMRVSTSYARHVLETYHYLHRCRVGRQINYAVSIDGIIDGVITYAYPMMNAPLCGVPSDELLEFARLYLFQNIPHTASCAVGQSLKRICADWMDAFPTAKAPQLVVSWSDTEYHTGTIYKAANFTWLRQGRPHKRGVNPRKAKFQGRRDWHDDNAHVKDCWIYWLNKRRGPLPTSATPGHRRGEIGVLPASHKLAALAGE